MNKEMFDRLSAYAEFALLGTMPDRRVAARVGRSSTSVRRTRRVLGVPKYGGTVPPPDELWRRYKKHLKGVGGNRAETIVRTQV